MGRRLRTAGVREPGAVGLGRGREEPGHRAPGTPAAAGPRSPPAKVASSLPSPRRAPGGRLLALLPRSLLLRLRPHAGPARGAKGPPTDPGWR